MNATQSAGIVPERTGDAATARRILTSDGASILMTGEATPDGASAGVAKVLGKDVRRQGAPMGVRPNPVLGAGTHPDAERKNVLADQTVSQDVHIDGFMMWGLSYPDYIFLLCAEPASAGGHSFVLDGMRLLHTIGADPNRDQRALWRFLWDVPVEHSTPKGTPHQCPVAYTTPAGRPTVRLTPYQRTLTDETKQNRLLCRWRELVDAAATTAPRFMLRPGELLCIDNYRMFHGREPYEGNRLLYRVWVWSTAAFGVPDDVEAANRGAGPRGACSA